MLNPLFFHIVSFFNVFSPTNYYIFRCNNSIFQEQRNLKDKLIGNCVHSCLIYNNRVYFAYNMIKEYHITCVASRWCEDDDENIDIIRTEGKKFEKRLNKLFLECLLEDNIEEFIKGLNDIHLQYVKLKDIDEVPKMQSVSIEMLNSKGITNDILYAKVLRIVIPTFINIDLNSLKAACNILKQANKDQMIIFDLRSNSGGIQGFIEELLKQLIDAECFQYYYNKVIGKQSFSSINPFLLINYYHRMTSLLRNNDNQDILRKQFDQILSLFWQNKKILIEQLKELSEPTKPILPKIRIFIDSKTNSCCLIFIDVLYAIGCDVKLVGNEPTGRDFNTCNPCNIPLFNGDHLFVPMNSFFYRPRTNFGYAPEMNLEEGEKEIAEFLAKS